MDFLKMRLHALRQKNVSTPFLREGIDNILADIEIYLLKVTSGNSIFKKDLRGITRGYIYLYLFDDFSKTDLETALGVSCTSTLFSNSMSLDLWKEYYASKLSAERIYYMNNKEAAIWKDELTGAGLILVLTRVGGKGYPLGYKNDRFELLRLLHPRFNVADIHNKWIEHFRSSLTVDVLLNMTKREAMEWRDELTGDGLIAVLTKVGGSGDPAGYKKDRIQLSALLYPERTDLKFLYEQLKKFATYSIEDWIEYYKPKLSMQSLLCMTNIEAMKWKDEVTGAGLTTILTKIGGKAFPLESKKARVQMALILHPKLYRK